MYLSFLGAWNMQTEKQQQPKKKTTKATTTTIAAATVMQIKIKEVIT